MSDTAKLQLPLLDAAQAQKHVTVNEALARLDAVLPASVRSRTMDVPAAPADGDAHVVPAGATGAWAGQGGRLALFLNGGWEFLDPWEGASFWVADERVRLSHSGGWLAGVTARTPGAAATLQSVIEVDHAVGTGATSTIAGVLPDKSIVFGVSARVTGAIGGATSWNFGIPGSPQRYGTGYGTAKNSFAVGITGYPVTYYGVSDLMLTSVGGNFNGTGTVRVAIHMMALKAPDPVP